jgi:serine/threonine-protein kinase
VVDRYELVAELASGGMATMYLGRVLGAEGFARIVAIKRLHDRFARDAEFVAMFLDEARLASRLRHPNVVPTLDVVSDGGELFLVMEYIHGESLSAIWEAACASVAGAPTTAAGNLTPRAVPLPIATAIISGVLLGLHAAHEAKDEAGRPLDVVHRDVSPQNVIVGADGIARVLDFGISKAAGRLQSTGEGQIKGKSGYVAPEQLASNADRRTDVYAASVVLWELLAGRRLFSGTSLADVIVRVLAGKVPPLRSVAADVSERLEEVVMCGLDVSPERRFATAREMEQALHRAVRPASTFEVAEWVEAWAGETLRDRARRVAEIEGERRLVAPSPSIFASTNGSPVEAVLPIDATTVVAMRSPQTSVRPQVNPDAWKAVAVIPFRNAGDAADDEFADGLTDDLIDTLSMTRGLRVRPRGARGSTQPGADPQEIGRQLGVDVIIDGSVRRGPSGVKISARMINVADGFQLWARRFERPHRHLLAVNDDVARAVAAALTLEASPERLAPADPRTIELYLRARSHYRDISDASNEAALSLLEQALEMSPRDPLILSRLAMAKARTVFLTGVGADRALEMAELAIEVAPDRGEPRLALAYARSQVSDFEGAARAARAATARLPAFADAHAFLGSIEVEIGRTEAAIARIELALSLDPIVALARRDLSRMLALIGHWDEAFETLRIAASTEPDVFWSAAARLFLWKRDLERAKDFLATVPGPSSPLHRPARTLLEIVVGGNNIENSSEFAALVERGTQGTGRARAFFAQIEAELLGFAGNVDGAANAIAKSSEAGLIDLLWLDRCPLLEVVRSHPRFVALRGEIARRAARVAEAIDAEPS